MQLITIRDVDGNPLYEGKSKTYGQFVETLVKRNKSLQRANLRGLSLRNRDFSNGDFCGADLSGADLTGSIANRANFAQTKLHGLKANGLSAFRANFYGCDIKPLDVVYQDNPKETTFTGASLTFSDFKHACIENANFSECALGSSTFVNAKLNKTDFSRSSMSNVDWSGATLVRNNFRKANLAPTIKIPAKSLPDFTDSALIAGNNYEGAELGQSNRGFASDKLVGKIVKGITVAAGIMGPLIASRYVPLELDLSPVEKALGSGAGFIAVAGLVGYIQDEVKEKVFSTVSNYFDEKVLKIRSKIHALKEGTIAAKELAVALMSKHEAVIVKSLMRSTNRSCIFQRVGTLISGQIDVIVCDRKHLAVALNKMSASQDGELGLTRDVLLVQEGKRTLGPDAIYLRKSGEMVAIWKDPKKPDNTTSFMYNADGQVLDSDTCSVDEIPTALELINTFSKDILNYHKVDNFDHDATTHRLLAGRDGTITVRRKTNGHIDNPHGPAIIYPDNSQQWKGSGTRLKGSDCGRSR
ncbi:pentapeptide repeat-containing protein [Flexibacterium corallicola]|uniref:pentapeptide repeat-containing protein n=1 Tax=Flexibacterium corallicola TaxID=3037259 RepID=UPI00286F102C|nr:pentapeptide repeat-containing protein [Pseudovibrio sp. M1P-2-3]